MKVARRQFTAKNFPEGSEERQTLNCDPLTSEYMPSYRYSLRNDDDSKTPFSYRTKTEAEAACETYSKAAST
jgi:hypothetical protein